MINYEEEIIGYLGLPSIPKKKWNGKDSFHRGVAVTQLKFSKQPAYAVCTFDNERDKEPRVVKVFSREIFTLPTNADIFIVPDYMETNVADADLDDESKKKAEELANEADELENEGVESNGNIVNTNEYFFDNIHNDDEAIAFIKAYNKRNKINGKVPKNHDTIVMRLGVIFADMEKKNKKNK